MNADDFNSFFKELWEDKEPFPWQSALMKMVAEQAWPETLDLPTSAGKTATIDIAIFHLALEADKPPLERRAPVRILFTIDRRLVVDDAYRRACYIRDRLAEAKCGILSEVAERLARLANSNEPLKVIELRGGLPREPVFIQNPNQPTIVLSTVDQVGSRLLFRGYGVSQSMRPIYAALVGTDSMLILDEAHLSKPFEETLRWIRRYQSDAWAEEPIRRPITVVRMTATPSNNNEGVTLLKDADWDHPVLGPRLNCAKLASLVSIKWDKEDPEETHRVLLETLTSKAQELMEKMSDAPVIGIVVNRVATARQIFERPRSKGDAVLLIGRTRPLDRDELVKDYLPRMRAGRDEGHNPRPLYVVATQTIEVGADIDFDGLVTEAAALDALRQRFGRLNRLGTRTQVDAAIVYVDYGRNKNIDPIYGTALVDTWKWMKQKAGNRKVIDFGIRAMKAMLQNEDVASLLTPGKAVPVLLPAHMDMFVQTMPVPTVEPEVASYLHGKKTEPEEVQVAWRADLPEELKPEDELKIIEMASALPPTQLEVLALPVRAIRDFLAGLGREDITDVEGGESEDEIEIRHERRYAVLWRNEDLSIIHGPNEIAPGDRLVMPSSYGGLDEFGWHPESKRSVRDIGDEAASRFHGRQTLRIHGSMFSQWSDDLEITNKAEKLLRDCLDRFDEGEDLSNLCYELIENLLGLPLKENVKLKLAKLQLNRTEIPYPGGVLLQQRPEITKSAKLMRIPLDEHCIDVSELAGSFAVACGFPDEIVRNEMFAGRFHDIGKADPRFQLWLYEGNPIVMRKANELLAKSVRAADWKTIGINRNQAGYPAGTRHECYSAAMVEENEHALDRSDDMELVVYLIGTHHGRGRPLMPTVDDGGTLIRYEVDGKKLNFKGKHNLELLGSGWSDMFWRLNRRYGYWGLASLEMLLRLADHRQSAKEEVMQDEA